MSLRAQPVLGSIDRSGRCGGTNAQWVLTFDGPTHATNHAKEYAAARYCTVFRVGIVCGCSLTILGLVRVRSKYRHNFPNVVQVNQRIGGTLGSASLPLIPIHSRLNPADIVRTHSQAARRVDLRLPQGRLFCFTVPRETAPTARHIPFGSRARLDGAW